MRQENAIVTGCGGCSCSAGTIATTANRLRSFASEMVLRQRWFCCSTSLFQIVRQLLRIPSDSRVPFRVLMTFCVRDDELFQRFCFCVRDDELFLIIDFFFHLSAISASFGGIDWGSLLPFRPAIEKAAGPVAHLRQHTPRL